MAVAYSIKGRGSVGDMWLRVVDITLDNAYPTGGYPLTAQSLGIGLNGQILFVDPATVKSGYMFEYDQVNQKLKAYQNGAGNAPNTELANNSAVLNGLVARCVVLGKGSPG